jgi:hypothetical protein
MQNSKWQISPDALYREIGGEAVMLHLASSTCFGLDPAGVRIWQLLDEGQNEQGIRTAPGGEYKTDVVQLEHDVSRFLRQLREAGMVHAVAD